MIFFSLFKSEPVNNDQNCPIWSCTEATTTTTTEKPIVSEAGLAVGGTILALLVVLAVIGGVYLYIYIQNTRNVYRAIAEGAEEGIGKF